jgi:hypothetical protein
LTNPSTVTHLPRTRIVPPAGTVRALGDPEAGEELDGPVELGTSRQVMV